MSALHASPASFASPASPVLSATPDAAGVTRRTLGWLPGLREDDVAEWRTVVFGGLAGEPRAAAAWQTASPDALAGVVQRDHANTTQSRDHATQSRDEPPHGTKTLAAAGAARLELRMPRLTPAGLAAQLERIVSARDAYLANLPVQRIVTVLDRVANRWLDPTSHYRREAEQLLPIITGYSEPAVRKGLVSYLGMLRAENVRRLLEEELPTVAALDDFVPRGQAGGWTRAFGPRLTVHVWSGNVPGLPSQSLVAALLVKSASFGKVASEEPLFATLLAESIAEVDPSLAACLAVGYWHGGDAEMESVAFQRAEAVIAYGSEPAIDGVRARVPGGTRLVAYGHKLSFGVVAREALTASCVDETVRRAAYDVVKYDQQGCLSPHVLYVERLGDTSPRDFALKLADALGSYADRVPRAQLTLAESSSLRQLRGRFELRRALGADAASEEVFDTSQAVVLYDEDPRFEASCLNRTVFVKAIDDVVEDVPRLAAAVRRYLQTCGVAASSTRTRQLANTLGALGLDRVCPLGRMGDVAATWHHDGRFNVLELLRWTDLEPDASAGRWELEHPELGLYGRNVPESEPDIPERAQVGLFDTSGGFDTRGA